MYEIHVHGKGIPYMTLAQGLPVPWTEIDGY